MAKYNYVMSKDKMFINPYNFVPVRFDETPREEAKKGALSGVITCKLQARTPLAILDTEKPQPDGEHKTYDFFKDVEGRPAIPAASIRGVVRNVYETLTDSCFSTMGEESFITARSKKAAKPGILKKENDEWKLYEAKKYMLKSKNGSPSDKNTEAWNCQSYKVTRDRGIKPYISDTKNQKFISGEKVSFEPLKDEAGNLIEYKNRRNISCGPVAKAIGKGTNSGILVIGEDIKNKHHESIFEETGRTVSFTPDILNKAVKRLKVIYEMYNDKGVNRNLRSTDPKVPENFGYPAFKRMMQNGIIPVWYIIDGREIQLTLAAMGRICYKTTLNELADKKSPCRKRSNACPACRLFGMIGETEGESIGSRVRFTDAYEKSEKSVTIHNNTVTLKELGSPHPSYLPFYANVIGNDYEDRNMPSYDDPGREIRGRKFYWHSRDFSFVNEKKTKRNATVKVCETKSEFASEFEFKVFFDSIDEDQLKDLIYALSPTDTESSDYCHKIGHGKPLGLGSAKITVEAVNCRYFEGNEYKLNDKWLGKWVKEGRTPSNAIDCNSETVKDLLKIMDFNNAKTVSYPYIYTTQRNSGDDNDFAPHHWFSENISGYLNGHDHEVQILPGISDEEVRMKAYEAIGVGSPQKKQKKQRGSIVSKSENKRKDSRK